MPPCRICTGVNRLFFHFHVGCGNATESLRLNYVIVGPIVGTDLITLLKPKTAVNKIDDASAELLPLLLSPLFLTR